MIGERDASPATQLRLLVAVAIGAAFAVLTDSILSARGTWVQGADFTYPWLAARFMLDGANPYVAIQSTTPPHGAVMFYPATAALLAMPFAWLSAHAAAVAFVAVGYGWLAFALTRTSWWPLALLASAPAYEAAWTAQWSPMLAAAALTPSFAWIAVAKPNMGLPIVAFQERQNVKSLVVPVLTVVLILTIASFVIVPTWVGTWLGAVRNSPLAGQYTIPILTVWGAPIALAALRWRDRDARLLLAMGAVPQNFFLYEQLLLLLIARTRRELYAIGISSWLAYFLLQWHEPASVVEASRRNLPILMALLYWPCTAFVLLRKRRVVSVSGT